VDTIGSVDVDQLPEVEGIDQLAMFREASADSDI
jgi:hypothetical protein